MARSRMPEEFFDTLAHHLPPEQPVGPERGRPRIGHRAAMRLICTNHQYESIDEQQGRFVASLSGLSDRDALRKAGAFSEDFWLKRPVSKIFIIVTIRLATAQKGIG